jgi:CRP/FNR family transcriptional regulator
VKVYFFVMPQNTSTSEAFTTPRLLERCPMFAHLTDEDRVRVAAVARVRTYARGETIIRDAEPVDRFFVVLDGDVKIYKLSPQGKEQILHWVRPFQSFAEAAVFSGGAYPASATALHETRLLEIPRAAFLDIVRADGEFALRVMASMAKWLRRLVDLVEDLSFSEIPARLARRVAKLAADQGVELNDGAAIDLPMSKTDLARMLGTVSETLSRVFSKLSEDGILDVDGRRLTIRDAAKLRGLFESGG